MGITVRQMTELSAEAQKQHERAAALGARRSGRIEYTIRIYGENVTFTRWQWEELLDDMRPESDNARRIRELLNMKDDGRHATYQESLKVTCGNCGAPVDTCCAPDYGCTPEDRIRLAAS